MLKTRGGDSAEEGWRKGEERGTTFLFCERALADFGLKSLLMFMHLILSSLNETVLKKLKRSEKMEGVVREGESHEKRGVLDKLTLGIIFFILFVLLFPSILNNDIHQPYCILTLKSLQFRSC